MLLYRFSLFDHSLAISCACGPVYPRVQLPVCFCATTEVPFVTRAVCLLVVMQGDILTLLEWEREARRLR